VESGVWVEGLGGGCVWSVRCVCVCVCVPYQGNVVEQQLEAGRSVAAFRFYRISHGFHPGNLSSKDRVTVSCRAVAIGLPMDYKYNKGRAHPTWR
jgi:hypothetical protein